MLQVIGKVSATEKMPSTIDNFYFWTDKGQILSPFDIVKVEHVSSNSDKSITYGVIEEITHVTDAASHFTNFISSNFGDTADSIGQMNRLGMNYVKAKVVCNTDDIYTPVLDGKQVSLCDEEDIRTALGLNDVKNPLVCGYLEMYQGNAAKKVKVELNSHFLIGPDGAHLNISGISGLAAKTSYSMFLLNAIQHKFKDIDGSSVAFVFFNVKGRDLMAIDETNTELPEKDKKIYADLGLSIEPFKNVRYYYPYTKDEIMQHAQSYAHPQDVERQKKNHKAFIVCSSLATVTFEKGSQLKTIGGGGSSYYGAFGQLKNLMTVDMSACTQVKTIGESAFDGDSELRLFKIGTETPPTCGRDAFSGINPYSVLKVPSGCADAYKAKSGWNNFASITGLDE